MIFKILHKTKVPSQYLQSMYKTSRDKNNFLENYEFSHLNIALQ